MQYIKQSLTERPCIQSANLVFGTKQPLQIKADKTTTKNFKLMRLPEKQFIKCKKRYKYTPLKKLRNYDNINNWELSLA